MSEPHLPHNIAMQLDRLRELSPTAAAIFLQQWGEIRGTWEREDFFDRIKATIIYWEKQLGVIGYTVGEGESIHATTLSQRGGDIPPTTPES